MDDKEQKAAELRDKFFKRLEDDGPPDSREFHPADINRIRANNDWLVRFLDHNENNLQESLKMMWETCEWRRNFGINDITESNVRKDYLEDGVCFGYGKDKDGKKLFVIKSKLHTKSARDFEELKRCIVYWFERLEREGNGEQISLFFDMIDAGLSNLDMELTKYLIGLFKNYYPNFLNYILILEMPWVLNAAFNIIKSWLPAKAIPKIKFLKKSTLKEYVDPSIALESWGGQNNYIFKFVSEVQSNNAKGDNKKVHFAGSSPITDQTSSGFGDTVNNGEEMLIVEPEVLTFNKSGNEVIGTITLKNATQDQNITYKIKTTSPEKFKVRPNTGILVATQKITITVTLQMGYVLQNLLPNDRFLVMCLSVKDKDKLSTQELTEFWKNNGAKAEQHRLICRDGNGNLDSFKSSLINSNNSSAEYSMNSLFSKISRIEERHVKLQNEFASLKRLLLLSTVLILIILSWIVYTLNTNSQNYVYQSTADSVRNKHDEV